METLATLRLMMMKFGWKRDVGILERIVEGMDSASLKEQSLLERVLGGLRRWVKRRSVLLSRT